MAPYNLFLSILALAMAYLATRDDVDIFLRYPRLYLHPTTPPQHELQQVPCIQKRFVKQNMLSKEGCLAIRRLMDQWSINQDYADIQLEGLDLYRLRQFYNQTDFGMRAELDTLFRTRWMMKQVLEEHYNTSLYFEYTHLTARKRNEGILYPWVGRIDIDR